MQLISFTRDGQIRSGGPEGEAGPSMTRVIDLNAADPRGDVQHRNGQWVLGGRDRPGRVPRAGRAREPDDAARRRRPPGSLSRAFPS